MRILLLGKNGQVGWELQRSLSILGEVMAFDRDSSPCGDLTQPRALMDAVSSLKPDVIVNAAAYTAVDQAESEPLVVNTINAEAPKALAQAAKAVGALLVQYSTDYVFDGSGEKPWKESDAAAPLNAYGRSKRLAEEAIMSSGCSHLILRTSWVYGAKGSNFAKTMLRLAQEKERLTVIDDQWGAPTSAELLADVTAHAIRQCWLSPGLTGLYHVVAGGEATWHGYASYVIGQAQKLAPEKKWMVKDIGAVPTSAFTTAAKRPANSRLDATRFKQAFGLSLPQWQLGVDRLLNDIL